MNPQVDHYLTEGCGRCPLGSTPACKVHTWRAELEQLRAIVLDCGLTEAVKWSVPCYTFNGHNVLIVSAFKEYCAVSFFKGALLEDPQGILDKPGENSQAGRLIRFTSVSQIVEMEPALRACIYEAIEVERAGLKVPSKSPSDHPLPEELLQKMEEDPLFKAAFFALTPGRQRGYLLYFSAPKQSQTRESRIEKSVQQILDGKGIHD